ncbi:MAG: M20/M25/M40 family metallo-hydrolase [Phenylobacterium sp.]|uniref:M28 family metallopeptidase n=1 Tax=Phenylobacterium sp. TaxID=1871053 RepID=UPI001A42C892|nr:M28 family peptidase [Phenylobacterium sp.]MBL8773599.1 M20/M25/M40 family metallo-hydrolase [Phenylobacterium sp.]
MKVFVLIAAALGLAVPAAAAPARAAKVCADCVTETMRHLADPKMRGRACGTADENAAARYLADRLKRYRVKGAAPGGGYLQAVTFRTPTYASPPSLAVGGLTLTQGREIVTLDPADSVEAPLVRVGLAAPEAAAGKMALYDAPYDPKAVGVFLRAGAAAVIAPAPESVLRAWAQLAERGPRGVQILGVEEAPVPAQPRGPTVIFARPEALAQLRALEGQVARFAAPRGAPVERTTYNVLAAIPGRTKAGRAQEAVLLSAHYDHVGVRGGVVYPGANDDASGTAAVVEFARMLASGRAPKRTVQFALFGCEEEGGHGARYFLAHPPVPLSTLVANLEFEMIGVPDPKDRKALMLTGWERTDLGPALRAQGASLVPDRYPEQNFFQRSDNYQLARKGVVAQTISAWPIPPTYHQPTDTLENLDLAFMVEVIQSLAGPIRWLIDGEFRPAWGPGMQP